MIGRSSLPRRRSITPRSNRFFGNKHPNRSSTSLRTVLITLPYFKVSANTKKHGGEVFLACFWPTASRYTRARHFASVTYKQHTSSSPEYGKSAYWNHEDTAERHHCLSRKSQRRAKTKRDPRRSTKSVFQRNSASTTYGRKFRHC